MRKSLFRGAVCVLFALSLATTKGGVAFGQTEDFPLDTIEAQLPQPPMRNIFFNVLWGSVAGGTVVTGWAILDDSKEKGERYKTSYLQKKFVTGATYGGLLGLAIGVVLSMKGIAFDESRSRIAFAPPPVDSGRDFGYSASLVTRSLLDDRQTLVALQVKF